MIFSYAVDEAALENAQLWRTSERYEKELKSVSKKEKKKREKTKRKEYTLYV